MWRASLASLGRSSNIGGELSGAGPVNGVSAGESMVGEMLRGEERSGAGFMAWRDWQIGEMQCIPCRHSNHGHSALSNQQPGQRPGTAGEVVSGVYVDFGSTSTWQEGS